MENLKGLKFTCDGPSSAKTGDGYSWFCTHSSGALQVVVQAMGPTRVAMDTVDATFFQPAPDDKAASTVLGYLATMGYEGADPTAARNWVVGNIGNVDKGKEMSQMFGRVRFTLSGSPTARGLVISVFDENLNPVS